MNTHLYFHFNPVKQEVFYVGIGDKNRSTSKHNRSKWWKSTVAKYGFEVQIIRDDLTWEQACVLETFWIKTFGRRDLKQGQLVNMTDGGDGVVGCKIPKTQEWKDKISISNSGERNGQYGKKPWNYGLKTPGTNKGRKLSEEHKEKIRQANLGKKASEETKNTMSESHQKRIQK